MIPISGNGAAPWVSAQRSRNASISGRAALAGALMTMFAFIRADHSAEARVPGPYHSGGCGFW